MICYLILHPQTYLYADDMPISCSADYISTHKLERDLNNSVAEIQHWAVTSNKWGQNLCNDRDW